MTQSATSTAPNAARTGETGEDLLGDVERVDCRLKLIDGSMIWTGAEVDIVCSRDGDFWMYHVAMGGAPITKVIRSRCAPHEDDPRTRDAAIRKYLQKRDDIDVGEAITSLDDFGLFLAQNPEILEEYLNSLNPTTPTDNIEIEASPEQIEDAMEFLRDPCMIGIIHEAIAEKLLGERKNSLFTFFVILSAKTDSPMNHRWIGGSSTGKSAITVSVVVLFPPEMLIMRAGMTPKVFYYEHGEEDENGRMVHDLRGKALIILEEEESQDFLREIKPILSHDLEEIVYSLVERVDNRNQTRKAIVRGHPSYVGLTTRVQRDEQLNTRSTMGTPDYKVEKFEKIIDDVADGAEVPWLHTVDDERLEMIRTAIRLLKPVRVIIPYMGVVRKHYKHNAPRAVRDFKQYRAVIESIAFLHQYQRHHIEVGGVDYIVANVFDLDVAARITESIVCETAIGLPKDVLDFYQGLVEDGTESYTRRTFLRVYPKIMGGKIGITHLVERFIEPLVDRGLLDEDTTEKTHRYALNEKNLSLSLISEEMLKEVCSDATKEQMWEKYISRTQPEQGVSLTLSSDEIRRVIESVYAGYRREVLKEVLDRCFTDEYTADDRSNEMRDNERSPGDKKPPEDVDETDGTRITRLIAEEVRKAGGKEDAETLDAIAAHIIEAGSEPELVSCYMQKFRVGHRICIHQRMTS